MARKENVYNSQGLVWSPTGNGKFLEDSSQGVTLSTFRPVTTSNLSCHGSMITQREVKQVAIALGHDRRPMLLPAGKL